MALPPWSIHQIEQRHGKLELTRLFLGLESDDVQTARLVLQMAADYHGRLQSLSQTLGQDEADECVHLEAEWTAMRVALVCTPISRGGEGHRAQRLI